MVRIYLEDSLTIRPRRRHAITSGPDRGYQRGGDDHRGRSGPGDERVRGRRVPDVSVPRPVTGRRAAVLVPGGTGRSRAQAVRLVEGDLTRARVRRQRGL